MAVGSLNIPAQPDNRPTGAIGVEIFFLVLYWLVTIKILIYINLVTLRLNSSNPAMKKMIYLLIFIVNVQ